jgi:hypothetical protein
MEKYEQETVFVAMELMAVANDTETALNPSLKITVKNSY